jgi:AraC family transcriptional regulator, ethanolamine operon transcriptional activator
MIQTSLIPLLKPAPVVDVMRSFDVDDHARMMASINLEQSYQQLFGGPFEGSMQTVRLGQITIFRESLNQTAFQTGAADPNHLTFATPVQVSKPVYWNGKHIREESMMAFAPGREFELRSSDQSTCLGISLPVDLLKTLDPAKTRDDWVKTFAEMDCWMDEGASQMCRTLSSYLDADGEQGAQSPLDLPVESAAESILDLLSERLASRQPIDARLRIDSYPRIARKARTLMLERIGEPLTVTDICSAIGCSRRALQYAFESVYDVKPLTYLRLLRLDCARKLLLRDAGITVQESAEAFGFHHLPRFAQYYVSMFGELPSKTLKKNLGRAAAGTS